MEETILVWKFSERLPGSGKEEPGEEAAWEKKLMDQ